MFTRVRAALAAVILCTPLAAAGPAQAAPATIPPDVPAFFPGGIPAPQGGAITGTTGLEGYDPGMLITDASFYKPTTMTAAQIQTFLSEKGSRCVPNPNDGTPCLKDYRTNTPATPKTNYCAALAAGTGRSAAQIISAVAGACGINPQVFVTLLQKEQGLVTASGTGLTPTRYARATGAGCPDFQPCDPTTATFFLQVYSAGERFRKYRQLAGNYRYQVGVNTIQYHPNTSCGTRSVTIRNQATAGLYNYTPYVANTASLNAIAGEGNACSAYGNRNFYRYMKLWFPASMPSQVAPRPTVAGTVAPGFTLTARLGTWTPKPASVAYQWLRNGTAIRGATAATLKLTDDDLGARISVRVTGSLPGVAPIVRTSAQTAAVTKPVLTAPAPTIAGDAAVGATLTANPGTWTPTPDRLTYQWYRVDAAGTATAITGQTQQTYTTTAADSWQRLRVRVTGEKAGYPNLSRTSANTGPISPIPVERVAGRSRFDTAVEVSKRSNQVGKPVYLATGLDFPDALAGGAAAAGLDGTLLLVDRHAIPANVRAELTRLQPSKIVVLGSAAVVSDAVLTDLHGYAPQIVRAAGTDRFATAVAASQASFPAGSTSVVIANGLNYPDALSAGSLFSRHRGPILLSPTAGELNHQTIAEVRRLRATTAYLLGSSAVVPPGVEAQLKAAGVRVVRLAGRSRYDTSLAIGQHAFPATSATTPDTVYFITGENYPDGLSVGPLAARRPGPVLLARGTCLPQATVDYVKAIDPARVVVVGSASVVAPEIGHLRPC